MPVRNQMKPLLIKFFGLWSLVFCLWSVVPAHAGIILRIMGVNPDEKLTQTVKLKAYLPAEVEPEDVIDKSDLEMVYDTQEGVYYVYGEYSLGPKQSIHKEIEIRDIWVISKAELEGLRLDTIKTVDLLENTQFKDRANFLKEGIEKKLDGIIRKQKIAAVNPQKHISEYRENMKFLESVKMDLILVRSLLSQAKPLPSIMIWKVFMGIIIFLGLIGFSLFFFWHKRAKFIAQAPPVKEEPSAEDELSPPEAGPEGEDEAPEEKKISPEDIEKMISEDDNKYGQV